MFGAQDAAAAVPVLSQWDLICPPAPKVVLLQPHFTDKGAERKAARTGLGPTLLGDG